MEPGRNSIDLIIDREGARLIVLNPGQRESTAVVIPKDPSTKDRMYRVAEQILKSMGYNVVPIPAKYNG